MRPCARGCRRRPGRRQGCGSQPGPTSPRTGCAKSEAQDSDSGFRLVKSWSVKVWAHQGFSALQTTHGSRQLVQAMPDDSAQLPPAHTAHTTGSTDSRSRCGDSNIDLARGSQDSWRLIENRQMERGAGPSRYPVRGSFGTRPTGTRSCRGRGTARSRPGGRTCG